MAVSIRLARHGAKKNPFYRIVVTDQRNKRDGRFIENIGTFDPREQPERFEINGERLAYWKGQGAQTSDVLGRLLLKNAAAAAAKPAETPASV